MTAWEVKVRRFLLLFDLASIQELHVREHWAGHRYHELWHDKRLTFLFLLSLHFFEVRQRCIHGVAIGIYHLGDVVKVAEKDASLREAEHAVKRSMDAEVICNVVDGLFQAEHSVGRPLFFLFFRKPTVKL